MGEWDWDWGIIIVFERENGRLFHICSSSSSNEKTVSVFLCFVFCVFAFVVFVCVSILGVEGGPTNRTGPYRLLSCCEG